MVRKFAWLVVLAPLVLAACNSTADRKDQEAQEKLQEEGRKQSGLPAITNFTEKKMMREIYELRDSQIRTWTYLVDMNGKKHLLCESVGYGIPYAAQYSNPQKEMVNSHNTIAQAEPNGLFMPASAEGTWIMAMTDKGPKPMYVEERVIVSPIRIPNVDESEALVPPAK